MMRNTKDIEVGDIDKVSSLIRDIVSRNTVAAVAAADDVEDDALEVFIWFWNTLTNINSNLVAYDDGYCYKVVYIYFVEKFPSCLIIKAMEIFRNNYKIQRIGCATFWEVMKLAKKTYSINETFVSGINDDVCKSIIITMKHHNDNLGIQYNGCLAIEEILSFKPCQERAKNASLDSIDMFIQLFISHGYAENILKILSIDPFLNKIDFIINNISNHEIVKDGLIWAWRFCEKKSSEEKSQYVQKGIGDKISIAMNTHNRSQKVQLYACGILSELVSVQSNIPILNKIDNIKTLILNAIQNFPQASDIVKQRNTNLQTLANSIINSFNDFEAYERVAKNIKKENKSTIMNLIMKDIDLNSQISSPNLGIISEHIDKTIDSFNVTCFKLTNHTDILKYHSNILELCLIVNKVDSFIHAIEESSKSFLENSNQLAQDLVLLQNNLKNLATIDDDLQNAPSQDKITIGKNRDTMLKNFIIDHNNYTCKKCKLGPLSAHIMLSNEWKSFPGIEAKLDELKLKIDMVSISVTSTFSSALVNHTSSNFIEASSNISQSLSKYEMDIFLLNQAIFTSIQKVKESDDHLSSTINFVASTYLLLQDKLKDLQGKYDKLIVKYNSIVNKYQNVKDEIKIQLEGVDNQLLRYEIRNKINILEISMAEKKQMANKYDNDSVDIQFNLARKRNALNQSEINCMEKESQLLQEKSKQLELDINELGIEISNLCYLNGVCLFPDLILTDQNGSKLKR